MVLKGKSFIINHFNKTAEQIFQRSINEVIGKPLLEAVPEVKNTLLEDRFIEVYQHRHPAVFDSSF